MRLYLSHSSSFDYRTELYDPLKRSLAHGHTIFFPHDRDDLTSKTEDIISKCDFLLAETSYPSTGQGIELGWADVNKVPILCFYHEGSRLSGSLRSVSNSFLEYSSTEDMLSKLEEWLSRHSV